MLRVTSAGRLVSSSLSSDLGRALNRMNLLTGFVGCLAVMLSVSAGEPSSWTEGWRLDRYSRIEGNLLIVDVPEGAAGGAAHKTVDLTKFPKGVELHIRCRGENITKPEVEWLGAKFMLNYTDGGGTERWRGAPQMSGTFDWCDWRFSDYLAWDCPGVLEQYKCYIPIDVSISKVLITYAASWRETGDALDLAKARTLADALVNSQAESGRIPTFWTEWGRREPKSDWLNCMVFSAMTLEDFASAVAD